MLTDLVGLEAGNGFFVGSRTTVQRTSARSVFLVVFVANRPFGPVLPAHVQVLARHVTGLQTLRRTLAPVGNRTLEHAIARAFSHAFAAGDGTSAEVGPTTPLP